MKPQSRPIRIVPLHRPGGVAAATGVAAPPTAQLTYRGGPLLTAVQAFSVFWGAPWKDAGQQATMQSLNGFLQFIVASSYLDQLAEYDTPNYKIGRGSYIGTATITEPPLGPSVTDGAIQQMLEQQVAKQALPAPTASTLYVVCLPPGVTVVAGNDRSCQVFCGYHDRSAAQLFYAILPYPNCPGCLGGVGVLDALTSVCSHELAEAITDPIPGQGWYDDAQGEIGDVCAWRNKKLGSYVVQLLWSNRAQACV
ncbi:MAG TPA: hypothetical protein VJN39_07145 [Gemmatimonadales bacterium]|nr:hypothetical protein [Gemmatimonadales bacterium]